MDLWDIHSYELIDELRLKLDLCLFVCVCVCVCVCLSGL